MVKADVTQRAKGSRGACWVKLMALGSLLAHMRIPRCTFNGHSEKSGTVTSCFHGIVPEKRLSCARGLHGSGVAGSLVFGTEHMVQADAGNTVICRTTKGE